MLAMSQPVRHFPSSVPEYAPPATAAVGSGINGGGITNNGTSTNPGSITASNNASHEPQQYYHLEIVQQPIQARAMGWGPKADSRRPVDPPPVINFQVRNVYNEQITQEITNNFILHASLVEVDGQGDHKNKSDLYNQYNNGGSSGKDSAVPNRLTGTTMVSLTHIRSPAPGKFFFLLHDLSIRQEGKYQLVFNVYEVMADQGLIKHRAQVSSNPITVYSPKTFPGLETSSDLIKEIASQGCRVRVRKESTFKRKKSKRHSATIPQSVATNLVNSMSSLPNISQFRDQNESQNPNQPPSSQHAMHHHHHPHHPSSMLQGGGVPPVSGSGQHPVMYAPMQYPVYNHLDSVQYEHDYTHAAGGYTVDDYRSTSMSASSSAASNPGYFRGYEALLSAAAHQQQSDYPTLPPTPNTMYDRDRSSSNGSTGGVQAQQQQPPPPGQQLPLPQAQPMRNQRSQSYPVPPHMPYGAVAPTTPPHYDNKPLPIQPGHPGQVAPGGQYEGYYQDPYFNQTGNAPPPVTASATSNGGAATQRAQSNAEPVGSDAN